MILFKKTADLRAHLGDPNRNGATVGFAPTMGALHDGHLSLVETSRRDNSITVSSIFINPTQFNDPKDFQKYPITIEKDIQMLEAAGCDLLFLPAVSEIYPTDVPANEHYDLGYLETILEGKYRPGHFQGVCKVVARLLDIVNPNNLYIGQKDYQQCMVISRLVELIGKKDVIKINICPIIREADGLAMSSRNMRLNEEERRNAPVLSQILTFIKDNFKEDDLKELESVAVENLKAHGFRPDYVEIADAGSLKPVHSWDGKQNLVVLAAAFLGEVRLIDNLFLN